MFEMPTKVAPSPQTEEAVRRVVHSFYQKVRGDVLLGPIFDRHIGVNDWPDHLKRMCDFWLSVLFQTGQYKGNPMLAHLRIADLGGKHFDQWMELFSATISEVCDETLGEVLKERALRMRANLQRAIEQVQG